MDSNAALCMSYEDTTNSLIIVRDSIGNNAMWRWGIDSREIEAGPLGLGSLNKEDHATFKQGPKDGILYRRVSTTSFEEIDVVNMVRLRTLSRSSWGLSSHLYLIYDQLQHAIIRFDDGNNEMDWMFLDRKGAGPVPLSDIVEEVSDKVGLDPAELDASALTELVDGVIVDRRMPARQFLEPMAAAHFFRSREVDWKVEFITRGQSDSFVIPERDMGAGTSPAKERLKKPLAQELEQPERVDITYLEEGSDFQQMTQSAKRGARGGGHAA